MNDTVLLRFLDSGLINVGGDDAKLGKLQSTSSEIAAILKKYPEKTPAFSLVAFDSEVPPSDPVIVEAMEVLRKQWPTSINTFAGVPITVVRALLLDALVGTAREDDRVAVGFVACARNVLPFTETGNERSIWADSVLEVEAAVDRRAEQEWATPSQINAGELKIGTPPPIKVSSNAAKVDRDVLNQKLTAATAGNPYWPNQNPQQWTQTLATGMANALAETIDTAVAQNKVAPIDLSAPIQQITSAVSAHVQGVLNAVAAATAGLQRRTNLIWWKQAMFSPSTQASYRTYSATIAAALMALDLHNQIPMFSPASVSAFLEETVLSLENTLTSGARSLKALVEEANGSTHLASLREEAASLYPVPTGRCTLSALIAYPDKQLGLDSRGFRDLIGVTPETTLTDAQWAAWIFRDLQAGRATKESPKKRTTKT